MNSAVILMAAAAAIGVWRLLRLLGRGRVDVLFGWGPDSRGREHPLFWLHVFVLLVVTVASILLALHYWGGDSLSQ